MIKELSRKKKNFETLQQTICNILVGKSLHKQDEKCSTLKESTEIIDYINIKRDLILKGDTINQAKRYVTI